jgi:aminoglycoside phosphotransferase (APT) family kinase protein
MKNEIITAYAVQNNIELAMPEPIIRRSDPLDSAAGAHIPAQGDIELFVDRQNKVVYKVGTKDRLPKYKQDYRALTIASDAGITVPRPVAEPSMQGDYLVYATEYIEHDPYSSPSPEATGETLAALHEIQVGSFEVATSKLSKLADFVLSQCNISEITRESIEERCVPCIEAVTKDMENNNLLIHGDVHLGNVLPTTPKPTLIDFEDSGKGSPLWDLAVLVQSASRFGLDPEWVENCLHAWQQASNKEIHPEQLVAYVEWRYWYGALSMIKRTQQEENLLPELQTRLKWVHAPTDQSKWARC